MAAPDPTSHLVRPAAWISQNDSGTGWPYLPNSRAGRRFVVLRTLVLLCLLALPVLGQDVVSNEGGDLAFGGPGTEPGKFLVLQDIAFDPHGVLYALDGIRLENSSKKLYGNLRVQKFDRSGKLLGAIDLKTAPGIDWGEKFQPQRVAADRAGQVYVTVPAANKVLQWNAAGKFLRAIEIPKAMAITLVGKGAAERLAVAPSAREVLPIKGWTWSGGNEIVLVAPSGEIEGAVALPQSYENVQDLAVDKAGNFFLKADPNAIYKFSPKGKLLQIFGGSPTTRSQDGSEVIHTVAVDSPGNVYTFAWGNPGVLTRFDADGQNVTQREGQFKWADAWSMHSNYTPVAIDPDDRVWVACTALYPPTYDHYKTARAVPAILRVSPDFFTHPDKARQHPLYRLGFKASVACGLPGNVSYELEKPVPMKFNVAPTARRVSDVSVRWRVFDALKNEVAQGTFKEALQNGREESAGFTWTPAKYGGYFVQVAVECPQGSLGSLGLHVGVTPRYPCMSELPPEARGGAVDPLRQLWTGLPFIRLHPNLRPEDKPEDREKKLRNLETQLAASDKLGLTTIVQVVDSQKKFVLADVTAIAERLKGRLRYLEVCNEPNFSGSPDDYFKIHEAAYHAVKAVDPSVKVMGPDTVNLDLNWLRRLYELGFKKVSDIVSEHDYEGHESIDLVHWHWKFAEMRKIMAEHGDAAKPIWQTERAIAGVRGNNLQGLVQAIRMSFHRDFLETLGIPSAHNNHYYLNQGGYSSVPTYVWSAQGPMPAALVMRTRHALTEGAGLRYAGTLDFGPTGNSLFLGVRYAGDSGQTVVLRNFGGPAGPLEFHVSKGESLRVTDAWGNATTHPVRGGKVSLTVEQLPLYVRLGSGQELQPVKLDWGRNLAGQAEFSYSAPSSGAMSLLNDGILQTWQAGDPNGDTDGKRIWQGELPSPGQSLEIRFPAPQTVSRVILRTPHPDNAFSTLLDYDLESWDGQAWKNLATVRRPMPTSEPAVTDDATDIIWMDDTNLFWHSFTPVQTDKLRLVVRETTRGFVPDDRAKAWGKPMVQKLMLREVEIYGPAE